eukprot:Blabericola_migrator_1__2244@NODE_161_length_12469_cov_104_373811_g141_i0_p3_GENE_NODE_161_length_12469_cov_104_373811_g141_i0NODE_161_length_12469_cov_104_373811_g141_i0_p3_ORF_typecomplete_len491_score55_09KH_1/PF00013_29/4_6e12KH_1/PF00013_29/5_9KH_1/PF00013_29/79KH_1/PF00013_29/1_1e09SLS/PF14611_6/2_7e09SLS/PF14611_6/26SLS/PF14611_6/0_92KH_2/PF07650_17/8_1e05KH_2/PF07650_17/0_044KH_4/PF13083_6/0_014KH_4/PF13083_6/1_2e03KH_4/PF13083_6/7_4e03KH_4/PF13083_6/4MOEP19/PF16005_5/0_00045MOEP19/PF160
MSSRHVTYLRVQDQTAVDIQPDDVGMIIGKGGARIREMEQQCQVRLRVNKNQVLISGSPANVANAKKVIQRLVGGGGICIMKDLDEKSIHSLLSAQEYLDALQNEYDCYIIVDQRNVTIESRGEVEQDAEAVRDLLELKLHELTELTSASIAVWDSALLPEIFNDPALAVLKDRTNLQVEVTKDDSGTGISLNGSRAAVAEAQDIIQAILAGEGRQALLLVLQGFLMDLDDRLMLDLQADIRDHVERPYEVEVRYTINGNRFELVGDFDDTERLKGAVRVLQEILIYYFPENCGLFFVHPIEALDWICGRDDNQLIRLQGRDCVMTADKHQGIIWVCASERQLPHVMGRLDKSLTEWCSTNCIIPLENPKVAGWIIGPRGERLKQLQNDTGATISCDDAKVHIKAVTEAEVEAARRAINGIIMSYNERGAYASGDGYGYGGNRGSDGYRGNYRAQESYGATSKVTSGGFPTGNTRGGRGGRRGRGRGGYY